MLILSTCIHIFPVLGLCKQNGLDFDMFWWFWFIFCGSSVLAGMVSKNGCMWRNCSCSLEAEKREVYLRIWNWMSIHIEDCSHDYYNNTSQRSHPVVAYQGMCTRPCGFAHIFKLVSPPLWTLVGLAWANMSWPFTCYRQLSQLLIPFLGRGWLKSLAGPLMPHCLLKGSLCSLCPNHPVPTPAHLL